MYAKVQIQVVSWNGTENAVTAEGLVADLLSPLGGDPFEGGIDYSGLFSEEPEKAATIAGLITIRTKLRPIRMSCI